MAAVSAETQEILDRLKKEGDLLRNRGKHSIKSVKIDLSKFEGVFDTIALNLAEQTEILRESLGIERDRVADEIRRRDLEEVKSVSANKAAEPESNVPAAQSNGGVLKLLSTTLGSVASGLGSLAIKGALGLAAGFALYNFAKGFINTKAGDPDFVDNFIDDTIVAIKDFKNRVIARAPEVVGGALDTMAKVKDQISGFGDGLEGFGETIDGVKVALVGDGDPLSPNSGGVIGDIKDTVTQAKLDYAQTSLGIKNSINEAQRAVDESIKRVTGKDGIIGSIENIVGRTGSAANNIITTAGKSVSEISKTLKESNVTLEKLNGLFTGVNFSTLGATFTRLSTELPPAANKILDFFSNPLTAILPSLTAGLVTGAVANQTGKAISGLKPEYKQSGTINPSHNLKTAIIGAVGIGIGVFGGRLKNWILGSDGMGDVDVENVSVPRQLAAGAVDILQSAAYGATIGGMFGPKGLLIGAVIGGILGIGKKLYNWFQRKKQEWFGRAQAEAEGELEGSPVVTTTPSDPTGVSQMNEKISSRSPNMSSSVDPSAIQDYLDKVNNPANAGGITYKGGNVSLVQNNSSGGSSVEVNNNTGGTGGGSSDPVYGVQ